MDGNRRWAEQKNLSKKEGHKEGALNLKRVLELLGDIGVKEITVFALSVSNLKRDQEELNYIWGLNKTFFDEVEGNDELWKRR
jgi:undecaprenyl diphosphate synthase